MRGPPGHPLAFAAPGAQALTCNIVLDRNGNVIYQDTLPPVDLSERGGFFLRAKLVCARFKRVCDD